MYVCMYVVLRQSHHITRTTSIYRWRAGEPGARTPGKTTEVPGTHLPESMPNGSTTVEGRVSDICYNTAFVHPSTLWSVHQSSCNHVPGTTAEAHSSSTETGRGRPVWLIIRPARLLLSNRVPHHTWPVKLVLNDAYDTPSFLCHLPGTAAAVVSKLRSQPLGLGTNNRCSRLD